MEQDKVDSVATHQEMADAKQLSGKHIEGSALLVNKQGGVRKLPVPSDDPNDPLNWSVRLAAIEDRPHIVVRLLLISFSGRGNGPSSFVVVGSVSRHRTSRGIRADHIDVAINGLSMTSGLGSVIGVFFGMYAQQGYHVEEIALLLTLPSLCIGLG